jgi:ATP-dependent DNA helicase RecG
VNTDLPTSLGRQETAALEFKREAKDLDALRRVICALSNDLPGAGGGTLLIGVADDGSPHPVDTSDQALLRIIDLRNDGKILDRPSMVVSIDDWDGTPVIKVEVKASGSPPVRFSGTVWVRPGPATQRAGPDDERALSERRLALALPFDSRPVTGAGLSDLDTELLRSTYLPAAVDAEVLAENHRTPAEQLASLRLCSTEQVPTACGLLIGGFDPSAIFQGAYLQFVRYEGDGPNSAVLDEEELRGNLIFMVPALESLIKSHSHTRLQSEGFRDLPRAEYPLDALRELLINALVHRNYESSNAPVRFLWFSDRIEVTNPGGPYGQVRADNFTRVNDYRNPSLAASMKTLGYVNRFGRGITRVQELLLKNGNPEPQYEIKSEYWSVTVRRGT